MVTLILFIPSALVIVQAPPMSHLAPTTVDSYTRNLTAAPLCSWWVAIHEGEAGSGGFVERDQFAFRTGSGMMAFAFAYLQVRRACY